MHTCSITHTACPSPPMPPSSSCKQACLAEAGWDLAAAAEALRLRGMAAAVKKATRHASEGLVGVAQVGQRQACS